MKIVIALLFMMLSLQSYAVDFVYRIDSRPPDIIFRDGFNAHGENRNFRQHITGDSCAAGSRDSHYIATTSEINSANSIARVYYSRTISSTQRYYRYRIRADNNFYGLEPSINYLTQRGVQFSFFERIMMGNQHEYVAVGQIPASNIQEAVELIYDRNTSQVHDGTGTSNAQYVQESTASNPGEIPNLPIPHVSVREQINAFGTLISACFSMRGVRDVDQNSYPDFMLFYDARPVIDEIINISHH